MLRTIYVYFIKEENKNYMSDNIEQFKEYMKQENINVEVVCDRKPYDYTESVFITDDESVNIKEICVVGYGLDCRINTPFIIDEFAQIPAQYFRQIYARSSGEALVIAKTKNLTIKEISLKDLDDLYELYETLKSCEYVEGLYDRDKEEEFTKNYIDNMYAFYNYGLWLVYENISGKLIGRAGIENREIDGRLCQELGYLIGTPYQRKGYAYEACSAIIEYAREYLDLKEMYVCIDKNNIPSGALAQKLGFEHYAESSDGNTIIGRKRI